MRMSYNCLIPLAPSGGLTLCRLAKARCIWFSALCLVALQCLPLAESAAQTDHTLPVLWHAQGATKDTWFGTNAAGLRDINHDGFDDIGVASLADHRTFVYYGGATADTTPDLRLPTLFWSITLLGDINGDGYPDIAGSNGVSVLIFHGNAVSLDTLPDDSLAPEVRPPGSGGSFAVGLAAADFDHDGVLDFALVDGNPRLTGSMYGRILFYSGKDGYGNHVTWSIPGPTAYDYYSNCAAIDLDGDSLPELVVSAQGGEVGDIPGRVMVFDSSPFDSIPDYRFSCPPVAYPAFKWVFGGILSNIGDFNHDGYEDLAIPAGSQGFIFYGGPGIWDSIPVLQLNTCTEKIAPAGDMNGDGISDIIVGDLCYNFREGRGEIFLGGHPPDAEMDYWMGYQELPKHYEEQIGYVVAPAGDFNGDGADDVILVSQNVSPWFYGDVFVLGGIKTTGVDDSRDESGSGQSVSPALTLETYPNPANSDITLLVKNSRPGRMTLWMADILGRRVTQLAEEFLAPGIHGFGWAGTDSQGRTQASGVYFAVAESEGARVVRRVVLLK